MDHRGGVMAARRFGLHFAAESTALKALFCWHTSPNLFEKKHENIFRFLEEHFAEEIKTIETTRLHYEPQAVRHIWVMWWQGFDHAPALVKKCVALLMERSEGYCITLLDKDNYKQYVDIPGYITDKFNAGKIPIANYSDVIRMALLWKYGGFWIDSTVLLLNGWDKCYVDYPFFSIKNHLSCIDGAVSKFRFATFFMYSKKGNSFFELMTKFLFAYWKRFDKTVDYMLIDYVMLLICQHNEEFQKMLNDVPYSNENVHSLRNHMNEEYSSKRWNEYTKETEVFKLTYKQYLIPTCKQKVELSLLDYFLNDY